MRYFVYGYAHGNDVAPSYMMHYATLEEAKSHSSIFGIPSANVMYNGKIVHEFPQPRKSKTTGEAMSSIEAVEVTTAIPLPPVTKPTEDGVKFVCSFPGCWDTRDTEQGRRLHMQRAHASDEEKARREAKRLITLATTKAAKAAATKAEADEVRKAKDRERKRTDRETLKAHKATEEAQAARIAKRATKKPAKTARTRRSNAEITAEKTAVAARIETEELQLALADEKRRQEHENEIFELISAATDLLFPSGTKGRMVGVVSDLQSHMYHALCEQS